MKKIIFILLVSLVSCTKSTDTKPQFCYECEVTCMGVNKHTETVCSDKDELPSFKDAAGNDCGAICRRK